MLSNALQVVITSLFMSVTISVSMSVFMSVPFRFHARPKIVLLDVDDFRGQMGDRPFDEDKSAVCGRDCVGRCGPPYKDGLWISGLGLSVTSCCDARDPARSPLGGFQIVFASTNLFFDERCHCRISEFYE
jgi:hypothetical protein